MSGPSGMIARLRRALRRTGKGSGSAEIDALIARVRAANLTYCGPPKLENLARAALRVRRENVPGVYLEAGVALGGSAIVIGHIKGPGARLELYDVYGMIPPPGERDEQDSHTRYEEIKSGASKGLGQELYYGYVPDLVRQVAQNLARFGLPPESNDIRLIPGLFEQTLHPGAVAFAHVDCDWYDSVKTCIDRTWPQISPGGVIVFDDYSSYAGCRKAIDEWLSNEANAEIIFSDRSIGVRRA